MDFLAAEFDEGFFVGAIAKDFCFLTVGPSYNNMTEIPRFCFNQSHYRSAFSTIIHWYKCFKQILLVSITFPRFAALGVQNCLKLAI